MSIVCRTMQSENQNAVREHRRPMETLKKKKMRGLDALRARLRHVAALTSVVALL